jgi:hypothetical protein
VSVIVIRLHPVKPTSGASFMSYLEGLTIEVSDRSFSDPDGRAGGSVLGTAVYDPNDPNATIVQHVEVKLPYTGDLAAVATAAIEIADPLPATEYLGLDLALTVTRTISGDTTPVAAKDLNYNIDLDAGPLPAAPTPAAYAALSPPAMYLALPPSLSGLPAGTTFLDVPTDGTPPPYKAVLKAMQTVVAKDPGPGTPPDLAALTPVQCRHIAREIVFNRLLDPLPEPGTDLESLYRDVGSDDTTRQQFEADLTSYYAVHTTKAEVLAKFVYGVSAALACQATTKATTNVSLTVPVFPGLPSTGAGSATISVVVTE